MAEISGCKSPGSNKTRKFFFAEVLHVKEKRHGRHHLPAFLVNEVDVNVVLVALVVGVREIVANGFLFAHEF